MRSKLFVPCARPDFFAKAFAGEADMLSFDLEDSVPADGKSAARERLRQVLASDAARASSKRLIVRINALGSPFVEDDIAALAGLRVDLVNLPKVESAEDVARLLRLLSLHGVGAGMLLNIETPPGLAHAAEIAAADPRVAGLQLGLNDLFIALGIDRADPRHQHAALWAVRLAAGQAGCFAYDGSWTDLADADGLRAEAMLARSLGFMGKSCIHPGQVPVVNDVFDGSDAFDHAGRLLAAAHAAARDGHGAFLFEGRMIDRPAIDAAEAIVARGRKRA